MQRNAAEIKQKILQFIRMRGPSIPVHISKHIDMSILFTSAFLSELLSEKELILSHMRIGSTPIYMIKGQEPQLEKFAEHIKGKEKEAYILLKEKKFLHDRSQNPPIRVALREIKDFAKPFQKGEELYWRYFTTPESEFQAPEQPKKQEPQLEIPKEEKQEEQKPFLQKVKEAFVPAEKKENLEETKEKKLDIFDKKEQSKQESSKRPEQKQKKKHPKKATKKKSNPSQKAQEKFFNKVKEFLLEKQAEILEIISANKSELVLKIKTEEKEKILVAFNQRRITEKEIMQAHKKSKDYNLPYLIMSLGEMTKKLSDLIEALKTLAEIEKIE